MGRKPAGIIDIIETTIIERLSSGIYTPEHSLPGAVHLAKEFGCSYQTIDRILRNLVEKKLVTRRRGSGTYPVRQQYRIAYLKRTPINTPGLHHLISDIYHHAAEEALAERNCIVKEFTFQQLQDRSFSPRLLRNFDGILCSSDYSDEKSGDLLQEANLPIVFFGSARPVWHFNCIIADWQSGLQELFSRIERPETRQYWIWDRLLCASPVSEEQYTPSFVAQEVLKAAAAFHVPSENIVLHPLFLQWTQSTELEAYKLCLKLKAPTDAIHLSTSDLLAFGLYDAFLERGCRIGEFDLISCDDLESRGISPYSEPTITSINHPKEQLVQRAIKLLTELIATGERSCFTIEIPTSLTIRKSGLYRYLLDKQEKV